ncbi:O-methyltransferase [Marinilongibacter aquaticus]|uniref:O-methyltransferase n=1 Tax=Marinilongibacter aquaticus TaxID=2975157 RepID=UPI0021BDEC79|nr:O-methyltransferase [Marinilongibacter aquaticus]UBM60145.1 O-methyltransferase [Marinilongibacter aquaticus]
MSIINPDIEAYCEALSDVEPEHLRHINRETHAHVLQPRMLSGHLQGRFLSLLSHLVQPKFVLEIGTYTGYSAICLSEGLQQGGKVLTLDVNEELESTVRKNLALANCEDKVEFICTNAQDYIPKIDEPIDLVFIDADKLNYGLYYDLIIDKVRTGGLIITDNVLWSGKIIDTKAQDKTTKYLRDFNQRLQEDTRTEKVLLPLRDGLFVSRKI